MPQNGPITLNRAQYGKTKAGRRDHDYAAYLQYIGKRRAPAAPADPLAPLTESQIQQRAGADVRAQVDPIIAELTRSIGAHTKAGLGAISGYSNEQARRLQPYEAKAADIYGDAQKSTASVNDALLQTLTGQGQQLSSELAGKLGAINAPGAQQSQIAGDAAQTGLGAGNAAYGIGSAALNELISQGASARNYAAKLPGIARAQGAQDIRDLTGSSSRLLADEIGKVSSGVPAAVAETVKGYRGNELDKQITAIAGRSDAEKARIEAQAHADERAADQAFELKKLNQQQSFDAQQAKLTRDAALAAAKRDYDRSSGDTAAQRRWEAKQAKIERDFTAKQNALNRKAAAAKKAAGVGGTLVP